MVMKKKKKKKRPAWLGDYSAGYSADLERHFEEIIDRLGFSEDGIKTQSLEELTHTLDRLNDALQHPEQFGGFTRGATLSVGTLGASTSVGSREEIGIMPLLLERKKLCIERIRTLETQNYSKSVDKLVEDLQEGFKDVSASQELKDRVKELVLRSEELAREAEQTSEEQLKSALSIQERELMSRIMERESRLNLWSGYLSRPMIASVVGMVLLLAMGGSLLYAMFTQTQPTEIVTSAFLLILGYFFGQNLASKAG